MVKEALVVVAGLEGGDLLRDEGVEVGEIRDEVGWEGEGHSSMIRIGRHFVERLVLTPGWEVN